MYDVPQICVFFCANCLGHEDVVSCCAELGVDKRKAICLPCSGKVDVQYLVKAFETGADGVLVLTCAIDDCRHLEGNRRARRRVQAVESLLDEIGIGKGRIAVLEVTESGHAHMAALLKGFCEKVQQVRMEHGREAVTWGAMARRSTT